MLIILEYEELEGVSLTLMERELLLFSKISAKITCYDS